LETEATQQELKQTDTTTADGNGASADGVTDESTVNQVGIQQAYDEYLKARKRLAGAFRGREFQDREAYVSAAWRYRIYEEAMEKAVKAREKAEREALNIYLNSVDKALLQASEDFRDRMMQALRECRHNTEQAWQSSIETSTDMTYVFENDVRIPIAERQTDVYLKRNVNKSNARRKLLAWMDAFLAFFHHDAKASVQKNH
jgi:hypothetical protein